MESYEFLISKLEELDRKKEKLEKEVTKFNQLIGKNLQKIGLINDEYQKVKQVLKENY